MRGIRKLSLRPYVGNLYAASSKKAYESAHETLFKRPDVLLCSQRGRFSGGQGQDDKWTYLIWGPTPATLAHELSHCVLHVFELCGIDPREAGGEPFCYMLSQLVLELELEP